MKKTIIIISSVILFLLIGYLSYKYLIPTLTDTYTLKGDYIPSVKTVLKETKWVSSYKLSTKNNVYFKEYEYTHQENVLEDLKTYTNYLIQMEQFEVLKSYDLENINNSSIYLGKKSHIDEDAILLINIDYTSSSYKIRVSKKKGTLLQ